MARQFSHTGGLRPGRSVFDLSHEFKLSGDMGKLYPVLAQEMSPGDKFTFGNQVIVRFTPLVAPVLHEVNVFVHYFFVPFRIIWDQWEEFISGGQDGQSDIPLPRWNLYDEKNGNTIVPFVSSLWDYLGFPEYDINGTFTPNDDSYPLDFKRRAYNLIWNEYYRDQNLQAEVESRNNDILHRNWEKDYFTSSLPFQQRGIAPALPISGTTFAEFLGSIEGGVAPSPFSTGLTFMNNSGDIALNQMRTSAVSPGEFATPAQIREWLGNNVVDFSNASTFDVADLRLVFQLQKWQERNARAGVRYTEFLKSHFGVSPRDDRLNRPEYCGGTKSRVTISEVLQTSSSDTTTPQANMAGHGISASDSFAGKYYAQEFGVLMGILSVMPRASYQQGFNRQDMRRTRYDFFFPEFTNLSEQAVENCEILWRQNNNDWNLDIFGYQGRYDELRYIPSGTRGRMRTIAASGEYSYDYWHLGRYFDSDVFLNSDFIKCQPSKRIFAVQDEDCLIINIANLVKGVRPLPVMGEPGLVDHW